MLQVSQSLRHFVKQVSRVTKTAFKVNEPVKYLIAELVVRTAFPLKGSRILAKYTLRGREVAVEHGTLDTTIFREIFQDRLYDMPEEVKQALPGEGVRVTDLGSNVGYFAVWADHYLNVRDYIGFEADPYNVVRCKGALDNLAIPDWAVIPAFASNSNGKVNFYTGKQAIGARAEDGGGEMVESVDVLPRLEESDFIKMDIEGAEWDILMDERFKNVRASVIVLEYHRAFCPSDAFGDEVNLCLRRAGFQSSTIFHDELNGLGMVWGYRP